MGIEHSFKENDTEVRRCPICECISTVKIEGVEPYISLCAGDDGSYFACQNPKCNVERIYTNNLVFVSGRE